MNLKAGNLFNYKPWKIKLKYDYSATNKILFYCNAGLEKIV